MKYPCRAVQDCMANSSYYAKDNRADYGHVCTYHYNRLNVDKQNHYAHVDSSGREVVTIGQERRSAIHRVVMALMEKGDDL